MPRYHDETIATLQLLGHGEVMDELHDAFREVEKAVSATGKDGTITLKIKIKANGNNKRRLIGDVSFKAPKEPARETYVFATEQGQYVENDPDQPQLPLNVAKVETREFRAAAEKPELREVSAPEKKATASK